MYDLASLNAARSHRRHHRKHHHRRHHHNRAVSTTELAYFGGQKVFEAGVAGLLGYNDAYNGEPQFFQTAGDPTSGIGLKAGLAILANLAQFAQLWMGYSFSKFAGPTGGKFLDGAVAGTASASFSTYMYAQGNTYGAAKRSKEKSASTAGLDYSRPAMLPAGARVAGAGATFAEVGEADVAAKVAASHAQPNPWHGYL